MLQGFGKEETLPNWCLQVGAASKTLGQLEENVESASRFCYQAVTNVNSNSPGFIGRCHDSLDGTSSGSAISYQLGDEFTINNRGRRELVKTFPEKSK